MRHVQHKKEAFWFYRFLSIVYDDLVNPFFWTARMREEALSLLVWDNPTLRVIDVGSGTGFTTQGIVQRVPATNVTCIDQSPHQMAKARAKADLAGVTFRLGDAEEIPAATDSFDRYVSAGSIEYWPEPQRGITEAYRVIKPGGEALLIGPLRPQNALARWAADTWMLFPEEAEYRQWFERAGFSDIRTRYVRTSWVSREPYGIAIAGRKPTAGASPLALPPVKREDVAAPMAPARALAFAGRLLAGSAAGSIMIPIALYAYASRWLRARVDGTPANLDPLTSAQQMTLVALGAGLLLMLRRLTQRK